MKKNNKIILVMGSPRSGTTFMNLLLNSHPNISITNEVNLVKATETIKSLLFRNRNTFDRIKSPRETWEIKDIYSSIPKEENTLFSMLRVYCTSIKKNDNIILFGDKLPLYYKYNLNLFAQNLQADLLIIYLTRNPLDVVSSMLRRAKNASKGLDTWKGPSTEIEAMNEWIEAWNERIKIKASGTNKILDINYDGFLNQPEIASEILADFLDIKNNFDLNLVNNAEVKRCISFDKLFHIMPELVNIDKSWINLPIVLNTYDKPYDKIIVNSIYSLIQKLKLKFFRLIFK